MSESIPRTKEGRRLLGVAYLAGDAESEGVDLRQAILAIEQEAARPTCPECSEPFATVPHNHAGRRYEAAHPLPEPQSDWERFDTDPRFPERALPEPQPSSAALRIEYNTGRRHGWEEGYRAASGALPEPQSDLDVERRLRIALREEGTQDTGGLYAFRNEAIPRLARRLGALPDRSELSLTRSAHEQSCGCPCHEPAELTEDDPGDRPEPSLNEVIDVLEQLVAVTDRHSPQLHSAQTILYRLRSRGMNDSLNRERLAEALRAIHGDEIPLPRVPRPTPEEWADIIAEWYESLPQPPDPATAPHVHHWGVDGRCMHPGCTWPATAHEVTDYRDETCECGQGCVMPHQHRDIGSEAAR